MIRFLISCASIVSISILVSGCKSGPLVDQKLYWATNRTKDIHLGNLGDHKFKVEKFKDERSVEPKNKIGENKEDAPAKIVTVDTQDLGDFVADNLTLYMKRAGVSLVDSGQNFTIKGEIKNLFVEETGLYRSQASIKFIVEKGGKAVYSETKTGSSKRFGKSYKFENYMEALSNSVEEAYLAFLNDAKLQAAVK